MKISWEKLFPGCEYWDDPKAIEKMRKQALANVQAIMEGRDMPKQIVDASLNVVNRLCAPQISPNVSISLTMKDIEAAKARAGLSVLKQIKALPNGK